MDAQTVLRIKPALTEYLHEFDDCFGRNQTRGHLATYVQGQLSDLQRKSIEPMADATGMAPRTLQEFLSLSRWDEPLARTRLQQRVARRHAHEQSVGIIDETSFVKKGSKTACVQRQHCGSVGKRENCVVSVHLGYATPSVHTLLDGELYLPEKTWHQDRQRCREAGIPDEVVYRSKWQIALEQYHRAVSNGMRFRWLTFDEGYGSKPPFLRKLDAAGQDYVAEVPSNFHVWTRLPQVLHRRHSREIGQHGRPRKYPRLKVKNNPTVTVANVLAHSPRMRRQPWGRYHVKDGSKGPMVWEAKHLPVYLKDEEGLPASGGRAHHLLVARNPLDLNEVKYFISNAAESTAAETLLLVAFSRYKIERMFEDSKMELGMDHFEVRKYISIQRHLILSCVSHLFLAEFHQQHRGEKTRSDDQPGGHGDEPVGGALAARGPLFAWPSRGYRGANGDNPGPQREERPQSSKGHDPTITRPWHPAQEPAPMSLAESVAL